LIVLDAIPADAQFTPSYQERRAFLESLRIPQERFSSGINEPDAPPLLLTTSLLANDHSAVLASYQSLKAANKSLHCEFFEGVVMKKADSAYPVQLRNSTEEYRGWSKHRFIN